MFPGLDLPNHRMGIPTYWVAEGRVMIHVNHGNKMPGVSSLPSVISFKEILSVVGRLRQVVYSSPENLCSWGRSLAWDRDVEAPESCCHLLI